MAREAEELARAARMLTGIRDVAEVGAQIVQSLVSLFGGHVGGVGLVQPDGSIRPVALGGPGAAAIPPELAISTDTGLVGRAFREGRLCWSADLPADQDLTLSDAGRRLLAGMGIHAALATPLRYRDRLIGVLLLAFRERRAFSQDESTLVQTFADHAAVALGNAGVYEEAGRRRREAEVVTALVRRINSSLDLTEILQAVAEGARDLCGSDLARIALRDPESGAMVFRYWVNVRYRDYSEIRIVPGRGLGGEVLRTGAPFRTENWLGDPFYRELARRRPALARRLVFVTGDVVTDEIAAFLASTGVPSLAKPFSLVALGEVVRRVLDG